jgi:hypothetical protein
MCLGCICLHIHMQSRRELTKLTTTPEPQQPEESPRDLRATRPGTGWEDHFHNSGDGNSKVVVLPTTTTAAHRCFLALCYAVAAPCATTAVRAARLRLPELPSEHSTPPLCQHRRLSQQLPNYYRYTIWICRGASIVWNCAAVK